VTIGIVAGAWGYRLYNVKPAVGSDTATVTATVTTPEGTTTSTTVTVKRPAVWLIAGVDERDGGIVYGHNDSVILAFVRPSTVTLLSIPRDTLVYIPRLKGYTKLAHAFVYSKYGHPEDGAQSLIETISYNFGVKVDRYIIFSFKGVEATIDAIGGIDIYLPRRVCYKRCIGPGNVHLNGRDFLLFWRARTTDLERISRQLNFLSDPEIRRQVIDKLSPEVVGRLARIWGRYIVSDTAPDAWLKLAYDIKDYDVETYVLKVTPEFGCYAQDLSVPVWVVKFDDQWLAAFYQREFGLAANLFIPGIRPDKNVGPFNHCIVESHQTTVSPASTASAQISSSQTTATAPATASESETSTTDTGVTTSTLPPTSTTATSSPATTTTTASQQQSSTPTTTDMATGASETATTATSGGESTTYISDTPTTPTTSTTSTAVMHQ